MKSVLGKFIQKEFGRDSYVHYADKLDRKESMDVFCDIYGRLRQEDSDNLNESLRSLLDTIQISIRISKSFWYVTLGCLVTTVTLLLLSLPVVVLYASLMVTAVCYCYKAAEFVCNRYCDRDVKIVLIYKIALFHLLEENCLQKDEHEI